MFCVAYRDMIPMDVWAGTVRNVQMRPVHERACKGNRECRYHPRRKSDPERRSPAASSPSVPPQLSPSMPPGTPRPNPPKRNSICQSRRPACRQRCRLLSRLTPLSLPLLPLRPRQRQRVDSFRAAAFSQRHPRRHRRPPYSRGQHRPRRIPPHQPASPPRRVCRKRAGRSGRTETARTSASDVAVTAILR